MRIGICLNTLLTAGSEKLKKVLKGKQYEDQSRENQSEAVGFLYADVFETIQGIRPRESFYPFDNQNGR